MRGPFHSLSCSQVEFSYSKHALDGCWVANADLDMGFGTKARVRIKRATFFKYSDDRIYCGLTEILPKVMQHSDYCAVKLAHQKVSSSAIDRQWRTGRRLKFSEGSVSGKDLFDSCFGRKIETQSQFNHGADDARLPLRLVASALFYRKLQGTAWIGLPKIDARSEPIIIVVAGFERLPGKYFFADRLWAPMVAQDKTGCETMQSRSAVRLGKLAILVDNANLAELGPREFWRRCVR